MFDKLKRIDWMAKLRKAFFLLPLQLAPKHHFKAARPGGHFLNNWNLTPISVDRAESSA
jgi:hypothetical protein